MGRGLLETKTGELPRAQAVDSVLSAEVFVTQQWLRAELLERSVVRYGRARDLAAHMLLNLDNLQGCWFIATHWLRSELHCQRVDTGFGLQQAKDYFPGFAESKDGDFDVPSFGCGIAVDNRHAAMQAMWLESKPLIFADIKHDKRINTTLRQRLAGARTKSKFGWALRSGNQSYGLICADWTEHLAPWESGLYDCFEQTVADVISPIIAVAKEIADRQAQARSAVSSVEALTAAEVEVARLVAKGMSYKEIARVRGRSFSTIDHQLRSIRFKTGAKSTASLVSLLAKIDRAAR